MQCVDPPSGARMESYVGAENSPNSVPLHVEEPGIPRGASPLRLLEVCQSSQQIQPTFVF